MTRPDRIAVIGAGSWGMALADSLARSGHAVTLWARRPEAAAEIDRTRRNERYLPGAELSLDLAVASDLGEAVDGAWLWVIAVPSQAVRGGTQPLAPLATPQTTVVSVTKSI